MPSKEELLRTVFGFEQFKPLQSEIIDCVLARRDTLAIMPTGGGKSLCYQLPALLFSGLTVVVSPLISLMQDQVGQLSETGIPALYLNSSLSYEAYQENMGRVRRGEVRLVYVAPETLLTDRVLGLLSGLAIDCLVIDEAHCISEWGHDFRPEYRQLSGVRRRFAQAVCLALTATATPRVRQDIQSSLGFARPNEFVASFNRPNLLLEVVPKKDAQRQTLDFAGRFAGQSGIVYCFSRRQVDELTLLLQGRGFAARPYHAGLSDEERRANQEAFIRDDVHIMVATIAFGMGINKPDVRFVLHHDLPKSIESYYQEIGRAGRDGLPAHCRLLYSFGDTHKIRHFLDQKDEPERSVAYQHLDALVKYAESGICRRVPLLAHFGETFTTHDCAACDNCRSGAQQETVDLTTAAQKFLSCVKRTGERFGAGHVTDVLLGVRSEKIERYEHHTLSTYGIGGELGREQWLFLARQLVQRGYLAQQAPYGTLALTPLAYEFFKSKEPFLGRSQPVPPPEAETAPPPAHDAGLFDLLKRKRKELADQAHVPPYVIFADKTLIEMATFYPRSERSLKQIFGVGERKLERYGVIFLELIAAYCEEHRLDERPKNGERLRVETAPVEKHPRHQLTGEAFNAGTPVEELAGALGVKTTTILEHLERYAREGHALRPFDFLAYCHTPAAAQQRALAAFAQHGTDYLRPVFEALAGEVDYDDLKLIRLHYLCHKQTT